MGYFSESSSDSIFQLGGLFSISLNSLFTYYLPYRVLLPLQQQLPQESLLMLLLLRAAVKHRRTIQLSAVAVLLLPVVQCFTVTTRLLPRMRIVSDAYFSRLIFNVNVDFLKMFWNQIGSSNPLYRTTSDVSRSSSKIRGLLNISKETMKGRNVESLLPPRTPPRMNKLLV
jgi:hypothetical protein